MRGSTVRNLMVSLLVLGVAGSVISLGTFAQFNAVTNNPGNTFSSGNIVFDNSANGGATCAATSSQGTPLGSATCSTLVTLTSMIAGDSKIGTVTLTNDATSNGPVLVNLNVTSAPSSLLDTNGPNQAGTTTAGLGLMVFECMTAASGGNDQSCGTASTFLVPVSAMTCTGSIQTGAGGFTKTELNGTNLGADTADVKFKIGSASAGTCMPLPASGGISSLSNLSIGGPSTVPGTTTGGLAVNAGEHLAVVVYLPGTDGNGMASSGTLTSTLNFGWTATGIGQSK